ncbi:PIN domain-containing protein [Nitrospirillum viridazoti]|uniref:PIN domain nuclease of toxin-antitoxin system n=1 Tax=Nitrospirillum amazonense TaxID=28077 RepID=A0A560IBH2_9PROT|nr:type II toxin-antitoxin system VapC family toxin [Nitrospirillum amazonense]TWB56353.1 PIN domain nuclease of toxin-antitoxin system [Nitrospirillum amazonense]
MSEAVLDSSALLAVLLAEPGAEQVMATLPGALLSTVNLAEIITKLRERGMPVDEAREAVEATGVEIVDYRLEDALQTADLRPATHAAGLSMGDRACLALACNRRLPAITADQAWAKVAQAGIPNLEITLIRPVARP